jgi:dinuclear metal center YbgI/SA1388 family protein
MTLEELISILEEMAPTRLAEDWDNVGLLLGDPTAEIRSVMTCLTLTPEVAAEAVARKADVIVSHHPILFRPVRSIRADRPGTDIVWTLARAGIAVISRHTAWDSAEGGANDTIAHALGLAHVRPMRVAPGPECVKFVVFVPDQNVEAVREAAFDAGAGKIGLYDECSFETSGAGTFRGTPGTNPRLGAAGTRERVAERRLEFICRKSLQTRVMEAIRMAHMYEEPAVDVYPLAAVASKSSEGVGRVGEVVGDVTLDVLAVMAAEGLGSTATQIAVAAGRSGAAHARRVAIACGAGDDLADDAIAARADTFVTGELRFHTVLKLRQAGVSAILVGHHASERASMVVLAQRLASRPIDIRVWASQSEVEPLVNLRPNGE